MAQVFIFGYVEDEIVPKQSQKETTYVSFRLKEYIGKGRTQTYQVWAWEETVKLIQKLGIKKGSHVWATGSLELVDCTVNKGAAKTKMLKVYCSSIGFVPGSKQSAETEKVPEIPTTFHVEELDGDREPLP